MRQSSGFKDDEYIALLNNMTTNKEKTFEQAIKELEDIVARIENEQIDLDEALKQYQQGVSLIKLCQDKLQKVEQQVKELDEQSNTLKELKLPNNPPNESEGLL